MIVRMNRIVPNKLAIREALLDHIRADLAGLAESQRASQDGATHEESRAENSKDTRSLESSYLARGLAERVIDLERSLTAVSALRFKETGVESVVVITALVSLEEEATGEFGHYFLIPMAGGIKLPVGDFEVRTLTPVAPLGRALLGIGVDDEVELQTPQGVRRLVVKHVS